MNGKTEKFNKLLQTFQKLAVDTSIFIYQLEAHPQFSPLTTLIFDQGQSKKIRLSTSVVTLAEVLAKPLSLHSEEWFKIYQETLYDMEFLEILDLDKSLAVEAARLRTKYHLRLPDAFQIAAAIGSEVNAFLTNDRKLKVVKEIKIICLSDYV